MFDYGYEITANQSGGAAVGVAPVGLPPNYHKRSRYYAIFGESNPLPYVSTVGRLWGLN